MAWALFPAWAWTSMPRTARTLCSGRDPWASQTGAALSVGRVLRALRMRWRSAARWPRAPAGLRH
eukprot:1604414-Alexandrium_andersonii.AAC.1